MKILSPPIYWHFPLNHPVYKNNLRNGKIHIRFGTWNVRSRYRTGLLTTTASDLARYKLDLVCVQEVRWEKGATVRTEDNIFFLWKRKQNHKLRRGIFVQHKILTAVKRVGSICDRMSHIVLRGRWCNIIVCYVHAQIKEKGDDQKIAFMRNQSRFRSFS
jgi:exonuclease III